MAIPITIHRELGLNVKRYGDARNALGQISHALYDVGVEYRRNI